MTKYMYKVTIITTGEIVMFENKLTAEAYVGFLKENNEIASLNKWTWKTEIEK